MLIKRLYTFPKQFEPITFESGFNVVLGEKDESSSKNNGVGKSLCIEFINFALLKKKSESRVSRIPKEVMAPTTLICVDFEIDGEQFTLRRSMADAETPELIEPTGSTRFDKLEHATAHLSSLLFRGRGGDVPSFREMLGPLIRDERSEFKSLVGCYDTALKLPDNYKPHLYLFGIDASIYDDLKQNSREMTDKSRERSAIEQNVKMLREDASIAEARADVNGLQAEVDKIGEEIEKLENTAGYEIIKDDIIRLETRIDELRQRRGIVLASMQRLKPITKRVELDEEDVRTFYDQLKAGLGTIVSRDLSEVLEFKAEIERFQDKVLGERVAVLGEERKDIARRLEVLEKEYKSLLSVLDQEGGLKNLRQTYAAYRTKSDEAAQLKAFILKYDSLTLEIQKLKSAREQLLVRMQGSVVSEAETIASFENTILGIHDKVQGNQRASFTINVTTRKQIIELNMRIDSDGSHSVEREKVFIYDYALLTNAETAERHPGFLVHDNVFEVDQDTLVRSLKYVLRDPAVENNQYILTLNADRVEQEPALLAAILPHVRAKFTKTERFLGRSYQEVR
ncbi:DUF2326 domain-containing protein [Rhizobium ruizarguesonis]|uniref:DUF2326 domain-containing protein n=1 Tax=Rhizobium ruizarguesonis TaxID=2081791 RepID=UPI00102F8609|nr:DUF2326 domain-containing protein [Rhizobium ruizarguesonis]TAW65993.1 DUF2326 domain-containing protein [Rhizobium ruizarguesonis]